jgi:hypothetical protein
MSVVSIAFWMAPGPKQRLSPKANRQGAAKIGKTFHRSLRRSKLRIDTGPAPARGFHQVAGIIMTSGRSRKRKRGWRHGLLTVDAARPHQAARDEPVDVRARVPGAEAHAYASCAARDRRPGDRARDDVAAREEEGRERPRVRCHQRDDWRRRRQRGTRRFRWRR